MCPSDSNGVYSLPSGYEAVTGEVIQASQHNPPLEDLASSMSARLMRSGVAPMTGAFKLVDGAVGSPGLQFSTDATTGFYKTANGIGVSVGGSMVAEFSSAGIVKYARWIGEIIPWTRVSAPSLCVLPYGQTLSRTTYADLWAIAQTEIAAGNTFYNNGNGTTTFGVGDLRGRVVAGKDNMGGSAASRITIISGTVLGAAGGEQVHTLTQDEMPVHYHVAGIYDPGHVHIYNQGHQTFYVNGSSSAAALQYNEAALTDAVATGVRVSSTNGFDTTYNAGSGQYHNNIQPTMICNYILFAGA